MTNETYINLRARLTRIGDIGYWIMVGFGVVGGGIFCSFIDRTWAAPVSFGIFLIGALIMYGMFFFEMKFKDYLRELKEAHDEEIRSINFKVKMGTYEPK